MRYIGNKQNLINTFIFPTIKNVVGDLAGLHVTDLFAGAGSVSKAFKAEGAVVTANDVEYYSFILNSYFLDNSPLSQTELASLDRKVVGFITKEYAVNRKYFTAENGMLIDGIRQQTNSPAILACLIEAADKVANTTGIYAAYCKQYQTNALKPLKLQVVARPTGPVGKAVQKQAEELINQISGDILYLDPPYNARSYSSNYHVLNTIAHYDDFEPKGLTGQRLDNYKSAFCSKKNAEMSFRHILDKAKFNHIFISYSSDSLIKDMPSILKDYGKLEVFEYQHRRYQSGTHTKPTVAEYLFYVNKM